MKVISIKTLMLYNKYKELLTIKPKIMGIDQIKLH